VLFVYIIRAGSLLYVPESPRWLLAQGRDDEALEILRVAAEVNGKDVALVFPRGTQLYQEDGVDDGYAGFSFESILILFHPEHFRMTILLWCTSKCCTRLVHACACFLFVRLLTFEKCSLPFLYMRSNLGDFRVYLLQYSDRINRNLCFRR
jgi:hypothetical protein